MIINIKQCPFCASAADCIEAVNEAWVMCLGCHAAGPVKALPEHAIECWNIRRRGRNTKTDEGRA